MAILRHRSICALSALILAAVCALCIVAPGCALAAEVDAQADDANSWRFADGQLLTVPGLGNISLLSSKSDTEFDATLTSNGYATVNRQTGSQRLIPGAISKGVDVSEHNRTIDWEAAKNDGVKFAIIRVGYGNDLTNQDDKYWLRNVSECERLGIPYGVYIYSYAKNADMARSEADHVLRLIKGHDLSYPVYFDMEDKSQFNATGGDPTELAKIASAFSEKIEAAGYEVGIYANRNWFTNYLTDPVFDNWVRWVAEYGVSQCQYGGEYGMWQLSSGGRVKGIDYPADDEGGRVDVNLMYRAGYSSDVAAGDWFVESGAFDYVVIREIMGNYSGTNHFGPYDTIDTSPGGDHPVASGGQPRFERLAALQRCGPERVLLQRALLGEGDWRLDGLQRHRFLRPERPGDAGAAGNAVRPLCERGRRARYVERLLGHELEERRGRGERLCARGNGVGSGHGSHRRRERHRP